MTETRRVRRTAAASVGRLLSLLILVSACSAALAEPPVVVDSQSIVRSLRPAPPATRGLVVAKREISLHIGFENDSDQLTAAAHAQLAELGAALNSPEL